MHPNKWILLALLVLRVDTSRSESDDLIAEESNVVRSRTVISLDTGHGEQGRSEDSRRGDEGTTERVLDFRIKDEYEDFLQNEVEGKEKWRTTDMSTAEAGNGKQKKDTKKDDDDDEKTLAQQVADGKYGLIQNELFANGSKRPGIISYASNPEVPKDTKANLGGLDKEEIWLAEDHLLVLRGGRLQDNKSEVAWPPIDDYEAPPRQVKIPDNPKIPPPFPIQLTENGPVEFVRGENGTGGPPPPPFGPGGFPFPPFPPNGSLPFPPFPPEEFPNQPFPPGQLPPFLANLPPGAAFLPPPGNLTDFDDDDPSIYYPPKYDFYYPQDNTTAVPPGPLVPGIILPPPPDFFAPLNDTDDRENETDQENQIQRKPPYIAPSYLPANRRPETKHRGYTKRPPTRNYYATTSTTPPSDISNQIPESSPSPDIYVTKPKSTVSYVYPENTVRTTEASPLGSFRTTRVKNYKVPNAGSFNSFTSPIYVPNTGNGPVYQPLPTTSPKPNHITIPTTLSQEIYIVSTPETEMDEKNQVKEIYKEPKARKPNKYENLRPEIHPLRSLIKPNVSVSYVGKYGHLPASTPFPYPKRPTEVTDFKKPLRGGHYITKPPPMDIKENVINTQGPDVSIVTVTPIPIVKKIRVRPIVPDKMEAEATPAPPSKATFYFYEESTTQKPTAPAAEEPPRVYYPTLTTPRTPVRQFLEETFHASNVLQNKPQVSPASPPNNVHHGIYTQDLPKVKHLNYGEPVRTNQMMKYHYITNHNPIQKPKLNLLEIENSGLSGLQTVQTEKPTTPQPYSPPHYQTPYKSAERPGFITPIHSTTTPSPVYRNTDGPFIPSNYYATARPEDLHFTPQDHSMIDDITKNYFTIFGQKINSASTTPLPPTTEKPRAKPPQTYNPETEYKQREKPSKVRPASGLSYISDSQYNVQQLHTTPAPPPRPNYYTTENPQFLQIVTGSPRPQSNFEQYLKELTGEDQKEFVVPGVPGSKVKKGKTSFAVHPIPQNVIPNQGYNQAPHPNPVYINPVRQQGLAQYYEDLGSPQPPLKQNYDPFDGYHITRPKIQYRPNYSTTLRPIMNVEIQPQYVQHISSTYRPFEIRQHPALPPNLRNHNLGQYLHEITSFSSPTTISPVKIKSPSHLQYFPTTSPSIQKGYAQYSEPQMTPKPISLEGDILVNYKPPQPEINPDAEIIDVRNPPPHYEQDSNFRIVSPPDLSGKPNRGNYRRPYLPNRNPRPASNYDPAKEFFENLPNSGYFAPAHQSSGNSFISYNLPGNGGHFYFLTPQASLERNDGEAEEFKKRRSDEYSTSKREDQRRGRQNPEGRDSEQRYSSQEQQPGSSHTNQDYLRRRRKKP